MKTSQKMTIETTNNSNIILRYERTSYSRRCHGEKHHLAFTDEKEALEKIIDVFEFSVEGLRKKKPKQ